MAKKRGRSAEELRRLRKKYKLGEFSKRSPKKRRKTLGQQKMRRVRPTSSGGDGTVEFDSYSSLWSAGCGCE